MKKSKPVLLGVILIFSAILVYGTALVVKLLKGSFLLENELFDLGYVFLTLAIAVPIILYILIASNSYKKNTFEVLSFIGLFIFILFVSVYFVSVPSDVDSILNLSESINLIIIFLITTIFLVGALHFAQSNNSLIKLLFIGIAFLLVACFFELISSEKETITDDDTKPEIESVVPPENSLLFEWGSDAMDRGNHDYEYNQKDNELVVDLDYSTIERGDVIYFKTPTIAIERNSNLPEYYIARAVGLPGETVEIKNGQVFIDFKKLDTFYSKATVRGMGEEEYFEKKKRVNRVEDASWRTYFSTNMKSVRVTEDKVFVLVDHWWRGTDSRDFGLLSIKSVEGKVLGYKK
jgi:signal peptidase I